MSPGHPDYLAGTRIATTTLRNSGGTWSRTSLLSQNSEQTSLTGFFAGLREWSATVKARSPPTMLKIADLKTDPLRLSGEQSLRPNRA